MTGSTFSLAGKTALVTGASSGLGHHFAGVLARDGAKVVIAARRIDRLEALRGRSPQPAASVCRCRSTSRIARRSMAAFDAGERAVGPIDIVVNNAGVPSHTWFLKTTEQSGAT